MTLIEYRQKKGKVREKVERSGREKKEGAVVEFIPAKTVMQGVILGREKRI